MKKLLLSVFMLFCSTQFVYALTNGDYYSTSQQGMMVYMYDGYYELQINNNTYQTGSYTVNGSSITFTPDWVAQGSMTTTTGTINGDCYFTWGQAGSFQNNNCSSGSSGSGGGTTGGSTTGSGTSSYDYATLDSSYNLLIPQLSISGYCYRLLMQLGTIGQNYFFKVTGVSKISSCGSYAAIYDTSTSLLYIPLLSAANTFYQAYLQLYSTSPDILFSIYSVDYANTSNPGGTSGSGGTTGTDSTSSLSGCYSPDNADWLTYYCYDGAGSWYQEDWNAISGCTGALHQGNYQIQGNTLKMCGSDGCTNHTIQFSGSGIVVDGEPYSHNNGCN